MKRLVDTVVFDLDGTLVDTIAGITDKVNVALRDHSLAELTLSEVRDRIGLGGTALVRAAIEKSGQPLTEEAVSRLQLAYLSAYAADPGHRVSVYPKARDLLRQLRDAGARLALCTNKAGMITSGLLAAVGLDKFFDAVVSADTLPYRKPDPRPLWHAVSSAGGSSALMVGDSINDVTAAQAAGIPVVCVTFGYHNGRVDALGPDLWIDHFDRFLPAVTAAGFRIGRNSPGPGSCREVETTSISSPE